MTKPLNYLLLAIISFVFSTNTSLQRPKPVSLKGLNELSIKVFIDSYGVENLKNITELNEYSLAALTEERLRDIGLKVTWKENVPELYFWIEITKCSFLIELYLKEQVRIERIPENLCKAYTWRLGFGSSVVVEGRENLLKAVSSLLDSFIEDYKNDNPREDNKNPGN